MAGRNEIELLIKARDEASRAIDGVNRKVRELEGSAGPASGALGNVESGMSGVSASATIMTAGIVAAGVALTAFYSAAQKGLKSIDDLRLAQASMASAAASNDPNKPWEEVYATTGRIVEKVYELDRAFIGTGDELLILSDSMVTFGMGIDLSTKKQQDQFVAFANMIKMMTRGQDFQRQAFQEVRSLMEGADVQGALLVKKLEAAGVNVKAMVPLWREQGVLLEKIMEILPGYAQGSKEVENTLQAQKSSLETITFKILREGMAPAYEDITELVKKINDSLMDQNGLTEKGKILVDGLRLAWVAVSTPISAAAKALDWLLQGTVAYYNVTKNLVAAAKDRLNIGSSIGGMSQSDWSASMAAEMGYDIAPGGLKLDPSKNRGESDEAKRAREKAAKDRERETKKLHEALIGYEVEFWKNYDKAIIDGNEAINKYTRDQLAKRIEMERKGAERQEELNLRLKALRDEAATPVKWPWNERDVTLMERMNEESVKFAENVRRLNKEFDASERGEGPLMTKDQYEKAFRAYQDAYGAALGKVREETDVTTQHVADAWDELFNGLGGEMSDVFFDAFKGKLDSLSDYMDRFTDIVRRAWANLISDMITEQLKLSFGGDLKSGLSSLAGLFGGGGGGSSAALAEVGGMTEGLSMFYGYKHGGIVPGGFMPIRAFAGGGIADRPTFGIVGEGGDSEAVIPLKGGKVPVEMRGGGTTVNNNFTIVAADTRDMDRLLMDRRGLIVGMVADGMRNASPLRDSMRRSM
ncbi:MAG: hypothetical protein M1377_06690 [Deltaproteobacteria bacterium]|nr:hypothetical protein [Deltaproteobacteria bacterium]